MELERKLKRKNEDPEEGKEKPKGDRVNYSGMFSPFSQGCDLFIKEMNKMA